MPADLHLSRGCHSPFLPFHLQSTGRCTDSQKHFTINNNLLPRRNMAGVKTAAAPACLISNPQSCYYKTIIITNVSYLPLQLITSLLFLVIALTKSKVCGTALNVQLILQLKQQERERINCKCAMFDTIEEIKAETVHDIPR